MLIQNSYPCKSDGLNAKKGSGYLGSDKNNAVEE
jgi:hypothetical protein